MLVGCASCLAAVVGCFSSSGGNGGTDAGNDTSPEFDSGGGDAEAEASVGPGMDAAGEATPEGGAEAGFDAAACNGSVVPASVTANTTLTAACSPWHLTGPTVVAGTASPVLTIEAGVTVLAAMGSSLQIGYAGAGPGGIHAVGTSSSPIVFTSSAATPGVGDWVGVLLGDQTLTTSQLTDVEILYAGAQLGVGAVQASLTEGEDSTQALALTLSGITLTHDAGHGVYLAGSQVGFGAGSSVTVSDWGTGMSPIVMNADQAGTLSNLTFSTGATGHDGQVYLFDVNNNGYQTIDHTQTWPSIAIPYLVANEGIQIDGVGTSHATLTIAGPNTVEFTSTSNGITGIVVDYQQNGQADLVASGVTFTSSSTSPTAGAWGGIEFSLLPAGLPNSSLTNCTFQYAGAGGDWSTAESCTGVIFVDSDNPNASVPGPTISGCTFADYTGDAIYTYVNPNSSSISNAGSYATGNTFASSSTGLCSCVGGTCM